MSNIVPNLSDGYKSDTLPQSLKVIQGGSDQMENSFIISEQSMRTATSLKNKTVFNRIGCLYLPVDDGNATCKWYEKYFNSAGTRDFGLFWETTVEKGLNCNFMTDEWVQGEAYEMFAVRFETDAIEELYERLAAANVKLEPLLNEDNKGLTFVYTDPQGNKFQVWQRPDMVSQPLRDDVPAFIGVAAMFFPASDPEATRKWYTEFLGVEVSESGHPMTSTGQEFYFYRSLVPGRTLNFYTGSGEIQDMSIVMISVYEIDEMHRRMIDQGQKVQDQINDREGCGFQFQLYDPDGNKLDIWDLQTIVEQKPSKVDSPNWKERFNFLNCCFYHIEVDTFLEKVINGDPGTRHRKIQILDCASLRENDPEGLANLIETLDQFSQQYPEYAFDIMYREGPSIF